MDDLPAKIIYEGKKYHLRIKRRDSDLKWSIRYIGKRDDKKLYQFKDKVRGYTYKTLYQRWGKNIEVLANRVVKELRERFNH